MAVRTPGGTEISVSSFDRPKLALANMLRGDVEGTMSSMLAPLTLSPDQRRTIAQSWISPDSDNIFRTALELITDPLTMVGLLLSYRFPVPTLANLTKMSSRFKGYERYISPFMKWIAPVDVMYQDTKFLKAYKSASFDMQMFTNHKLARLAKLLDEYTTKSGKPLTFQARMDIVGKLDGMDKASHSAHNLIGQRLANPYTLGKHEERLFLGIRKLNEEFYDEVIKVANKDPEFIATLEKTGVIPVGGKIGEVENYFSRIDISRGLEGIPGQSEDLLSAVMGGERAVEAGKAATGSVKSVRHLIRRTNGILPDPIALGKWDHAAPGAQAAVERTLREKPFGIYSMDLERVMSQYTHSMARGYAWSIRGHGKVLSSEYNLMKSSSHPMARSRAMMARDYYVPSLLGRMTHDQNLRSLQWSGFKLKTIEALESKTAKKYLGGYAERLKETLLADHGSETWKSAPSKLASYFYVTALGANPGPAVRNSLQTVLTGIPVLGPRAMMEGMEDVFKGTGRYLTARQKGMTSEVAFRKAFPEAAEVHLRKNPITDQVLRGTLEDTWISAPEVVRRGQKGWQKAAGILMAPFSASETGVRLAAFQGALRKGAREGLRGSELRQAAYSATELINFIPGPGQLPYGLRNLPVPARMFMMFPLRYLNLLINQSTVLGSGAQATAGGRNWGTLGRMMAASGATYTIGKEVFGTDLSRSLMFGALPLANEDNPFAPWPLVSPPVGIVGAALSDLTSGSFDKSKYALPSLIPGGVAIARASGYSGDPSLAIKLGREYTDYSRPDEHGRYPIYTARGQLMGHRTPVQMLMRASGTFGGGGTFSRERETTAYLNRQAEQISDFRRRYVEAWSQGDTPTMASVSHQWSQKYPQFPELSRLVKQSDIRALRRRKEEARLSRVFQNLPPDMRPQFAPLLRAAQIEGTATPLRVQRVNQLQTR